MPLHGGAPYVERSPGLGDALGFVPTDPATFQAKARPNVFVLGDATDVPTSKAGSVTHFEGEVLSENVERFLAGRELLSTFDGQVLPQSPHSTTRAAGRSPSASVLALMQDRLDSVRSR